MLTGAVITETIFAWPGMGKLLIDSINVLDRPIIVAYLLVIVILFVFIGLLLFAVGLVGEYVGTTAIKTDPNSATGDATEYRIEHDTMGEVRVPVDALWRAQTQRAVENFPISGRGLERAQIRAFCAMIRASVGAA